MVQTKCPPLNTQCPTAAAVVETQCPIHRTKCPPLETVCPPLETVCPPPPPGAACRQPQGNPTAMPSRAVPAVALAGVTAGVPTSRTSVPPPEI